MTSIDKFNMFDPMLMASRQSTPGSENHSSNVDQHSDLLLELHQQVDRWMINCNELWIDQDVVEDLTMIKIMIESWMTPTGSQTINDKIRQFSPN